MARSFRRPAFVTAGFLAASTLAVQAASRSEMADAREASSSRHGGTVVVASAAGDTGHVISKVVAEPVAYGLGGAGFLAALTFIRRRKRLSAIRP